MHLRTLRKASQTSGLKDEIDSAQSTGNNLTHDPKQAPVPLVTTPWKRDLLRQRRRGNGPLWKERKNTMKVFVGVEKAKSEILLGYYSRKPGFLVLTDEPPTATDRDALCFTDGQYATPSPH